MSLVLSEYAQVVFSMKDVEVRHVFFFQICKFYRKLHSLWRMFERPEYSDLRLGIWTNCRVGSLPGRGSLSTRQSLETCYHLLLFVVSAFPVVISYFFSVYTCALTCSPPPFPLFWVADPVISMPLDLVLMISLKRRRSLQFFSNNGCCLKPQIILKNIVCKLKGSPELMHN